MPALIRPCMSARKPRDTNSLFLAMDSGEPAVKRRRRVWLCNGGRAQSVFMEEGDIGDDVRRKAEPNMDDKQLSYVRLVTKDGTDIDLFEAVPADVGVCRDTALRVVVDTEPDETVGASCQV